MSFVFSKYLNIFLTFWHALVLDVLLGNVVGHSERVRLAVLVLSAQNALAQLRLFAVILVVVVENKIPLATAIKVVAAG